MSSDGKMKMKRITEVGVAVKDLEEATQMFVDLFDAKVGPIVDMPLYSMRYCMCRVGKVDFELMQPVGDEGVIAKFLKKGGGLHHVAFAVEDLGKGIGDLQRKGVRFVGEEPVEVDEQGTAVDFAGRAITGKVKFIFSVPSSTLGILFEFIQYPPDYRAP
jgi:methylmalonyl-CoA/ethylmalonyl-CoA epimerase